jgi:hypothetical protein
VGLGPLIRLPLLHWPDYTARLAVEGIFESGWFHDQVAAGSSPLAVLAGQVRRGFGAFGFVEERGPHYNLGMPILDPFSTTLFVAGVGVLMVQIRRPAAAVVLLWLLGAAAGTALLVGGPGSEHYVTVAPVVCLAIAVAIDTLARGVASLGVPKVVYRVGVATAVVLLAGWSLNFYFRDYSPRNTYGLATTETASKLARFIAPRARDSYVYLSVTNLNASNATLRFIAPDAHDFDVLDEPLDEFPPRPPGFGAVFVVSSDRRDALASIERRYPGGRLRTVGGASGAAVLTAYVLEPGGQATT